MKGTYAYSLDRESYTGIYNSREEAFRAGCVAADRLHAQLNEIYVGQRVAGDPQADLHAWEVIKSMRDRARSAAGDDATGYLKSVTAEQARDLDGAIESAILRWLANHKVGPAFHRIESVSEHALPSIAYAGFGKNGHDTEVHDLGESEYPVAR
ncbi:MAG: hypothetical protein ABIP55_11750 [Tepidisphaeraceae bacterium]